MKNLLFGFAAILLLTTSCYSQTSYQIRELDAIKDAKLISDINSSGERGIPYPVGSTVIQNSDKTISITLPSDYFYVMQNNKGEIFRMAYSGSVTCSCAGGGCSPVLQGGNEYCVMSTCSACTKSSSRMNNGIKEDIQVLGIFNENEPAIKMVVETFSINSITKSFQTKDINFSNLPSNLFKFSELNKNLNDFYNLIYNNKIPNFIIENKDIPDNNSYKYVYVSLYGNLAVLPVPNTAEFSNLKMAASVSCSCGSGSGCTKESMMGVRYCDAGSCSKCTLSH